MKSVNAVILLGNVTRDPEYKTLPSGRALCTFGLATNRVWKDASGARQSLAEYHNLVCWGALAEFCDTHVRKGKPLHVQGHLKTRSWDDAEGVRHVRTEIVVDDLVLLGVRKDDEAVTEDAPPVEDVEQVEAVSA